MERLPTLRVAVLTDGSGVAPFSTGCAFDAGGSAGTAVDVHRKADRMIRRSRRFIGSRFIGDLVNSGKGIGSNMKKGIAHRGSGIGKEGDCA
jgi:hypothetical protein